ncbi:MAG: integration host factor subunit beta [Paludibacteraceae bacterium]|nr:integration host factor subunit beta [Paludibacteraceae bacterium]
MTKAELVNEIAMSTGYDKATVGIVVESFMDSVIKHVSADDTVYLRGFGCFGTKTRAAKVARNISKNISVAVPSHKVPFFKAYPEFEQPVRKLK